MKYKTIPEMFFSVVNANPDKNILNFKSDVKWESLSGSIVKDKVESLSAALLSLGFSSGDKIAILSNTSYKCAICDYSILSSGMTTVTVYPTLAVEQVEFILKNSETKLIFVENAEQYEKINSMYELCDSLKYIVLMNDEEVDKKEYVYNIIDLFELGKSFIQAKGLSIEDNIKSIKPNDLVTLIYTSGTTGMPKGVMLSHNNLISNLTEVSKLQDNINGETFLSFLPLSHVLERMAGHFFALWSN